MHELPTEQIEENFAEIAPPMTEAEAAVEANRCLYCYDAPCMHACPTHIDVPSFIKKIASGNLTGSARVIFDANPIGATCARVCPVEVLCEGACVEKTLLQKPIEIGRLQRYATDHAIQSGKQLFETGEPNGRKVAVVGSGPAGISCSSYLARLGYDVTVYDRRPLPGGLNTYGMAEYKMTQSTALEEVREAERLGVKFRVNIGVGSPEFPFDSIRDTNDAVFIATGLGATNRLNIPGEELAGVIDALAFIERVKSREWHSIPLGRAVAVIGAGNTAIDAATQAKRLGAEKVMLIYRRTESDAPAYDYEKELAKKDGIQFYWQTTPIEIIGTESVLAIRCTGKDGFVFDIPCDQVIKAIGQTKTASFFSDVCNIEVDDKGRVIVNDKMQTSDPKIFAGGDCVNGGGEAVEAAQMGKIAAQGIHLSLTGEAVFFAGANVNI
jgi:dihydropyrimidine dehydrogenase (NAD+) subunit PreT